MAKDLRQVRRIDTGLEPECGKAMTQTVQRQTREAGSLDRRRERLRYAVGGKSSPDLIGEQAFLVRVCETGSEPSLSLDYTMAFEGVDGRDIQRSPAGGSAAEDATDERPPTSLRTAPTGRPRGLFSDVLVLGFLADVANVFHQIIVARLRRVPANRTPRNLENEARDQKRHNHAPNVVGCERMSNTNVAHLAPRPARLSP
jgi:hypothetical protein